MEMLQDRLLLVYWALLISIVGLIYHDNIIIESHNHNEYPLLYKDTKLLGWWVGYTLTEIITSYTI